MSKKEDCSISQTSIICPYLEVIKTNTDQLKRVERALIGEDMQSGLVAKLNRVEMFMKVFIFVAGSTLIAAVGLGLKVLFGG